MLLLCGHVLVLYRYTKELIKLYLPIYFQNCSNPNYFYSDNLKKMKRFEVPKHAVPWHVPFPKYQPPEFTSQHLPSEPYADPDIHNPSFKPKWNSVDGPTDRTSYEQSYRILNGYPLNPRGRTGIKGRGVLPRWGPNHAAESIVTRWKRGEKDSTMNLSSGKPVLQVVVIRRHGCSEWTLPGGLIEINSDELITLQKQLLEEALNLEFDLPPEVVVRYQEKIGAAFVNKTLIYRGYVENPRNTDNAWIESTVFHVHDEEYISVATLPLPLEEESDRPMWRDVDFSLPLFPGYYELVKKIASNMKAHW